MGKKDIAYVKQSLEKAQQYVTVEHVQKALDYTLSKPQIRVQIDAARKVYDDAARLMAELADHDTRGRQGFGLPSHSNVFDIHSR